MTDQPSRRSSARRLAGSLSVYAIARFGVGAIRLITVPFIVHAVTARTFGTLATLVMAMLLIRAVADFGVGTAALRLAPECESPDERRSLFGTMLSIRALAAVLLTSIVLALSEQLARLVTGSSENAQALQLLVLARLPAVLYDGLFEELRAREAIRTLSGLILLSSVLVQGLSVVFVVGIGLDLRGLIWARVVGETLGFVAAAILGFRFVWGRPSAAYVVRLLGFGWPLGVVYLLDTLRVLDRQLIRTISSIESVAAYELAMRLVGPVGIFNIALGMVLEPFVYRHARSRDVPAFVQLFVRCYVAVFATVAMTLSVFGREIITWFAPAEYHAAIRVLPALAFATTCEGLLRAAGIGVNLAKKTRVWAIASLLTLLTGFALAVFFVPRVGIAGAGFAWVFANAIATLLVYYVARRATGILLPVGRALGILIAGAALGSVAEFHGWPLPARLLLLGSYAASSYLLLGVRWFELKSLLR